MSKLDFTSPIVSLTVRQGDDGCDSVRHAKFQIHESVLIQLPYFQTLFSERWVGSNEDGSGDTNSRRKELPLDFPPLSTIEDFGVLTSHLYSGMALQTVTNTDINRVIGLYAICTMLQADELASHLHANLSRIASGTEANTEELIATLQQYSGFDDICTSLADMQPTIDDETFMKLVRGCYF